MQVLCEVGSHVVLKIRVKIDLRGRGVIFCYLDGFSRGLTLESNNFLLELKVQKKMWRCYSFWFNKSVSETASVVVIGIIVGPREQELFSAIFGAQMISR